MLSLLVVMVCGALAYNRWDWWKVAFVALVLLVLGSVVTGQVPLAGFTLLGVLSVLFGLKPCRRLLLSEPLRKFARRQLPDLSPAEQQALLAGGNGLEADLLAGRPQWPRYMQMQAQLSADEQAFLDGPVNQVCGMVDDWQVTQYAADLPEPVWAYLKEQGFFGLVIPRRYGGKGFSAVAHSEILTRLNSHSMTLGVTVAVPNSLGPGELLHRYGTEAQQHYYLPRLARGEDIPCFALTSPDAGSDATAILDEGTVCQREVEGSTQLGIRLSFDKRYITLAPVATLIGLAFKLQDPQGLLGDEVELGITCALIPRDTAGLRIGRRHLPLDIPFQNGPIAGEDVFIPLEQVIGGRSGVGRGWQMLVECLSAGRGISLPSGSTGAALAATLMAGAYASIRHQFGLPLAAMEGVQDTLARMVSSTVVMDATRRMVAYEIDAGHVSGTAAAIVKYHVTERGRQVVNDAMDVHGGKGIMVGPNNHLARAYQGLPIAITVEGANIMTRSLMIFGQGAIKGHPYLLREMQALQDDDGDAWDRLLARHIGWTVRNLIRASALALWCGATAGFTGRRLYRAHLDRFSAALAVLTDVAMLSLGGSLKRRQSLAARLGDLLSQQYMAAAVLSDSMYDYRSADYMHVLRYTMESLLAQSDRSLHEITRNWPSRSVGRMLSLLLRPLARTYRGPRDADGHAVARLVTQPTRFRANLARPVYRVGHAAPLGRLEEAMDNLLKAAPIVERLKAPLGLAKQYRRLDRIAELARQADLVTDEEFDLLVAAAASRLYAISVDDFDPADLVKTPRSSVGQMEDDEQAL